MTLMNGIGWIVWKDVVCEWRNREAVSAMFFFAIIVLLTFSVSLSMDRQTAQALMPGLIWVAFSFTGIIGLGRSFLAEVHNDCLEQLQISPIPNQAVYVGKLAGNVLFMFVVELCLLPMFVILFHLEVLDRLPVLVGIVGLGTVGLAALGTLFSAMTVQTRAREVLFPILLLPLVLPIIIGAVEATRGILQGVPFPLYRPWIELLAIADLVFLVVSYWLFEFVLET